MAIVSHPTSGVSTPPTPTPSAETDHIAGCLAEYPLGCHGIECACPCHPPAAQVGELVHDLGSDADTGWFIVGDGGYWDVDNACWTTATEGDAPWTSERFQLFGAIAARMGNLVIPPEQRDGEAGA